MKVLLNFKVVITLILLLIVLLLLSILVSMHSLPYNMLSSIGKAGNELIQRRYVNYNPYLPGSSEMFYGNKEVTINPLYSIEEKITISPKAARQSVYACDGEKRDDRKCIPGYTQACIPSIACKCADGWEVNAGPADGCVQWKGSYIPKNAESYAFAGECEQICRLTGRAQ